MMVLLSGIALPEKAMRQYIAGAVNMIVQIARLSDGTRRVVKITEITGMEGDSILTQDIFEFVMSGISSGGKVQGQFRPTKTRSFYLDRMSTTGIALPPQMFQNTIEV